jgi:hypothetical protein
MTSGASYGEVSMTISLKSTALGLAAFGALAVAAPAWAGCGDAATKSPAMYETGKAGDAHLIRVANDNSQGVSIAGLWGVTFYQGATTNVFDYGYAAWHSDGTEIMNSATRAPASENFCMGVWTQTGPSSYRLVHYALSYDPMNANNGPAAKVIITENVTLNARGNAFAGTYSMVVIPTGGSSQTGPSGNITGQRITAN